MNREARVPSEHRLHAFHDVEHRLLVPTAAARMATTPIPHTHLPVYFRLLVGVGEPG